MTLYLQTFINPLTGQQQDNHGNNRSNRRYMRHLPAICRHQQHKKITDMGKSAICPLDFSTDFDAYNYALAYIHDENALAVAIPTDAHHATYLRSLVVNGGKLFAVWSDALEETANGHVYTTEAGAREAMAQIENDDKAAGIYEPNYWKVIEMTRYYE